MFKVQIRIIGARDWDFQNPHGCDTRVFLMKMMVKI